MPDTMCSQSRRADNSGSVPNEVLARLRGAYTGKSSVMSTTVADTLAPLIRATLHDEIPVKIRCWDGSRSVGTFDRAVAVEHQQAGSAAVAGGAE